MCIAALIHHDPSAPGATAEPITAAEGRRRYRSVGDLCEDASLHDPHRSSVQIERHRTRLYLYPKSYRLLEACARFSVYPIE